MHEIGRDWRVVDGAATAWFDAPSMAEGAALAGRALEQSSGIVVDLRRSGVRMRLDSDAHAEAVSAAARDLGLAANPAVLQRLSVVLESTDPSAVRPFWQHVLDYVPAEDGGLADPLARDPAIRLRHHGCHRRDHRGTHLDRCLRLRRRPDAALERDHCRQHRRLAEHHQRPLRRGSRISRWLLGDRRPAGNASCGWDIRDTESGDSLRSQRALRSLSEHSRRVKT